MKEHLERRTAIITAGAGGMGREICLQLAGAGVRVIAADSDPDALSALASTARGLPGELICQRCDISRADDVSNLAAFAHDHFGAVDMLFNHAGVSAAGGFEAIPFEAWERLMSINVLGTVRMMGAFVPAMLDRGSGHIINTASTLALFLDSPWHAPYLATKAAIVALSRSAALQFANRGVKISVFCPDFTATGFHRFSTLHGLTLEEFRGKAAPPVAQQPAEAVRSLLARLDDGAFLISMAPDTVGQMHATVDAMTGGTLR